MAAAGPLMDRDGEQDGCQVGRCGGKKMLATERADGGENRQAREIDEDPAGMARVAMQGDAPIACEAQGQHDR